MYQRLVLIYTLLLVGIIGCSTTVPITEDAQRFSVVCVSAGDTLFLSTEVHFYKPPSFGRYTWFFLENATATSVDALGRPTFIGGTSTTVSGDCRVLPIPQKIDGR